MNAPRCDDIDYINYLIATPRVVSCTEAARVQPLDPQAPAHDSFTRLLNRDEPDTGPLWDEVGPLTRPGGLLVLDDSVLDKPYAKHVGLVGRFWSGKHKRVVKGIDLLTLLWTDGDTVLPCDYRVVDPAEGKKVTKNHHFRSLLDAAKKRGMAPRCVAFDSWYSGKENLKAVRGHGWTFLTQVRRNRRVNLDRQGNRRIDELPISPAGTVVHLEGFGLVKAFRIVASNGDTGYWVTNDLGMDELTRLAVAEQAWGIEVYHRGLKQHRGAERCQMRQRRAQRNHIGMSIRAFVRLEWHRFTTGVSWFEAKVGIIREALRLYLTQPVFALPTRPTA